MLHLITVSLLLSTLNSGIRSLAPDPRPHPSGAHRHPSDPRPFARGTISTEDDEFGMTFTPDSKTCYFTKRTPSTLQSSTMVICLSIYRNGKWTEPRIAPFSGRYKDFNPCISPDGNTLFFISNRPAPGKTGRDTDIWMVKKEGSTWTEPQNIGAPVNTTGWELGCSVTTDGTLYYSSTGTTGTPHIYCSRKVNGQYQTPDSLGASVNSVYGESDPFIAPDESYLIFASTGRPDDLTGEGASARYPRGDLYVSYRNHGIWQPAQHLEKPINTEAEESSPFVTRDGKSLCFVSERNFASPPLRSTLDYTKLEQGLHHTGNGLGDIYQVPMPALFASAPPSPAPPSPPSPSNPSTSAPAGASTSTSTAASSSAVPSTPPAGPPTPPYTSDSILTQPHLFAEGIISTKDDEFGGAFTPDGKTCYFSKSILRFYLDIICYTEYKDGKWQTPKIAPFSGTYRDFNPVLSPDGKKMVFTSNRPVNGQLKKDYDIWMVEKKADNTWSDPIHLDTTINSPYDEHFASIAASGTIYFSSNRPGALGGEGDADFYYAKWENGHYTTAVHLTDSVSTSSYELDCLIAPDESFLLMGAYGRPDGYGSYDIYISKKINGKWQPSRNLGPIVNTAFRDYSPRISPDGKYLFFTSEKDFSAGKKGVSNYLELEKALRSVCNGSGNIYQIDLSTLDITPPGH